MLVHRCLLQLLLLEAVGKVQDGNTAGNWAAREFEAGRLSLLSLDFTTVPENF